MQTQNSFHHDNAEAEDHLLHAYKEVEPTQNKASRWKRNITLLCVFSVLLGLVLGIFFTQLSLARDSSRHGAIDIQQQLDEHDHVFEYKFEYAQRPSEANRRLWRAQVPKQGTFFNVTRNDIQHRATISVFHQLHCLKSLHDKYWLLYDATFDTDRDAIDFEELKKQSSISHIRHCIDLLRQSLMCQPDTTIELFNETLGGVTGFGTQHRCRDWGQLLEKIDEFREDSYHVLQIS